MLIIFYLPLIWLDKARIYYFGYRIWGIQTCEWNVAVNCTHIYTSNVIVDKSWSTSTTYFPFLTSALFKQMTKSYSKNPNHKRSFLFRTESHWDNHELISLYWAQYFNTSWFLVDKFLSLSGRAQVPKVPIVTTPMTRMD